MIWWYLRAFFRGKGQSRKQSAEHRAQPAEGAALEGRRNETKRLFAIKMEQRKQTEANFSCSVLVSLPQKPEPGVKRNLAARSSFVPSKPTFFCKYFEELRLVEQKGKQYLSSKTSSVEPEEIVALCLPSMVCNLHLALERNTGRKRHTEDFSKSCQISKSQRKEYL